MPEHFPFRKLPGKKRQIDLKGIARHSLMGSLENKTHCPVVGESQKVLAQDLCLPVAEKWLPMMKLWAVRWEAGCGEARGGGHCSPLLAFPPTRGRCSLLTCHMHNPSAIRRCQNYLSWLKRILHFNDSCSAAGRKHQVTATTAISSKILGTVFL